jgi:branched-subunit amino acid aminotransferase/4-amino-4-deoxychorismate lyase
VNGVGLEVLRARFPELREADVSRSSLPEQRELLVVNSVRGPVPVVEFDGQPVADGTPGAWAHRLLEALAPPVSKLSE